MSCVFITGATSGIGLQLAKDYAALGWRVIACGRNHHVLAQLKCVSRNIETCCFDVLSKEQTLAALATLPSKPNLWIFNAGTCEYLNDGDVDSELIARVVAANLFGLAHCLDGAQHHFSAGDRVAVVGSIASELALPRAGAYGASKAAVSYLLRSLSLDWQRKGISTSLILPGFVQTPLTNRNDFAMPMLISVEQASRYIQKGLKRGRAVIYFPPRFTTLLRVLSLLPYAWQQWLVSKSIARSKKG